MILNALYELYGRLRDFGEEVPSRVECVQSVGYRIVLNRSGEVVGIEDIRMQVGNGAKANSKKSVAMIVPRGRPRSSNIYAYFMCDTSAYMLGVSQENPSRAAKCFKRACDLYSRFKDEIKSESYDALCAFYSKWKAVNVSLHCQDDDLLKCFGVFRLQGEEEDIHNDARVQAWWNNGGYEKWKKSQGESRVEKGVCSVTGDVANIEFIHDQVKGVTGTKNSSVPLISYNCDSFLSYGKEQGANSSVSEDAAFAYCNALNFLLRSGDNHLQIEDSTVVFWTDSPQDKMVDDACFIGGLLGNKPMDTKSLERIRRRLEFLAAGRPIDEYMQYANHVRFYILGLSPNASRISVRFFYESTLGDFVRQLQSHFSSLLLQRRSKDPDVITPFRILRETVRKSKDKKDKVDVPPLFGGALMRSIFTGIRYPDAIASAILRRFHRDADINYVSCAYLKAWLTRKYPTYTLTPMLDTNNTQPGYVLGRLFAAFARTQEESIKPPRQKNGEEDIQEGKKTQHKLNRSIKEAFYSSASSTPRFIFPRLFNLSRHHLAKMEDGRKFYYDRLIQEISGMINNVPAHLPMEQQCLFALGFYHQTQAFFSKETEQ